MVDLQDAAARMYAAKKFRNASKGITAGAADFDLKEDMFDDKLEDDKLKDKATKKATEGLDEKETVQVETETMMDQDDDFLDSLSLQPFHDLDGNKIG
tara:strand:- start:69 stop:362 length:294 start_codon:yes stop_codon:yes gene_type:complete